MSLFLATAVLVSMASASVDVNLGNVKIGDKVSINDDGKEKNKNKGNKGKSEYAPGHQGKSNKKGNSKEDDSGINIKIGK